jgi:metacaspase-1
MKKTNVILSFLLAMLLMIGIPSFANASQHEKVDKNNPVFAKDVELAKKVQVKGDKAAGKLQKPAAGAATGVLGDLLPKSGNKYAIVIGISNYPRVNNDLDYCDDDAIDMGQALMQYGFKESNIKYLIDSEQGPPTINATRSEIISAIQALDKIDKVNDEIVFYFSGHGGRGKADDGDNEVTDECIWAHDGTTLVPIWDGELAILFNTFTAKRIIFIFDSCYAGGMTDLAKDGRIIAMASAENSLSAEFSTLSYGEFTYYMIEQGMLAYYADKYDSMPGHDVTIEESWDYAKLYCRYDSITINDAFVNDLLP